MKIQSKLSIFTSLLALVILSSGCSDAGQKAKPVSMPKMDAVVSAKWLKEHLSDPDLVVLDSTVIITFDDKGNYSINSGRANYDEGHIPSAGFADLKGNLSDQQSDIEFMMPSPQQFSQVMGALGVGNDSRVVIYSANNEDWAARVWWMLRWAGFDQVALLDGGLKAWVDEGGTLSKEPSKRAPKKFSFNLREGVVVGRDEVFSAISNPQITIADALSEEHYQGKFSLYSRKGHIVSAINLPSSNYTDSEFFKSVDELDLLFDGDRNKRVITYCGGGIAASNLAFSLVRAGFTDVAIYDGSLEEWTANPDNPMTTESP
jgi:thiosulfate/3-mercaptopyruvate sulfurtransferase